MHDEPRETNPTDKPGLRRYDGASRIEVVNALISDCLANLSQSSQITGEELLMCAFMKSWLTSFAPAVVNFSSWRKCNVTLDETAAAAAAASVEGFLRKIICNWSTGQLAILSASPSLFIPLAKYAYNIAEWHSHTVVRLISWPFYCQYFLHRPD
jgi:hypothetical protein